MLLAGFSKVGICQTDSDGNLSYPPKATPHKKEPALIAGLIKGNQWLINKALFFGGVALAGVP